MKAIKHEALEIIHLESNPEGLYCKLTKDQEDGGICRIREKFAYLLGKAILDHAGIEIEERAMGENIEYSLRLYVTIEADKRVRSKTPPWFLEEIEKLGGL